VLLMIGNLLVRTKYIDCTAPTRRAKTASYRSAASMA
jgi:hypothetical protein